MSSIAKDYSQVYSRLCHFVALQRSPTATIQVRDRLVLTAVAVFKLTGTHSLADVRKAVVDYFAIAFSEEEITQSIDRLVGAGQLIRKHNGELQIAAQAMQSVEAAITAASDLEMTVREEWLKEVSEKRLLPPSGDKKLWQALQAYLSQMFARHGSQTLEFLAPRDDADGISDKSAGAIIDEVVVKYLPQFSMDVGRAAVRTFLQTTTPARTKYLAQLLDGTFSFFALTVDHSTSDLLRKNLPHVRLMVDTNFIFGLLKLHLNPYVSVTEELVKLVRNQKLPFDLYYHPITIKEFLAVLEWYKQRLIGYKWNQGLSRGILRAGSLSGIETRYHELNAVSPLDPKIFFDRYTNVERLLHEFGIRPFREPYDHLLNDEKTFDLISRYKQFLAPKEKPAGTLQHDIVLWRVLQLMRQKSAEPFGPGAMLLSCDYLFCRFDQRRLKSAGEVGTVILPNVLLQLLRPFTPRTDDFNARFVETFALPEFRTLYNADLKALSRITQTLAVYGDIPEDLAVKLLSDEALLARVRDLDEKDPEIKEIIESAIVQENQRLRNESELLAERLRNEEIRADGQQRVAIQAAAAANASRFEIQALKSDLSEVKGQAESASTQAEIAKEAAVRQARATEIEKRRREATQQNLMKLASRVAQLDNQAAHRAETRRRWLTVLRTLVYLLPGIAGFAAMIGLYLAGDGISSDMELIVTFLLLLGLVSALIEGTDWFARHTKRNGIRMCVGIAAFAIPTAIIWPRIAALSISSIVVALVVGLAGLVDH